MDNFLELLAVPRKEDDASPRPVANADNVAGDDLRTVRGSTKGLVVVSRAIGVVCNGVLVITWEELADRKAMSLRQKEPTRKSKQRIRLGGHANRDQRALGLFVDLGLPVVDVVLLGHGQVAHDGALGIEEFNLGSGLNEAVCNFQLRLKLPGRHALFLDGKELREGNIGLRRLWRVRRDECYQHGQYVGQVTRCRRNRRRADAQMGSWHTFGPQILRPGHVVHVLQGLGLFPRKRLLVVIFTRSADAIEDDAAGASTSGRPEDEDDEEDEDDGAKGRHEADDDARQGGGW